MGIDINISYELSIVVDFTDRFSYLDFIDCTGSGYSWLFGTAFLTNLKAVVSKLKRRRSKQAAPPYVGLIKWCFIQANQRWRNILNEK